VSPLSRRVEPGEPITAEWANSIAEAVSALEHLSVSPPLELSRDSAGFRLGLAQLTRIELFELTEDLIAGSSAEAEILAHDGMDWLPANTHPIVVVDALGTFDGMAGDRGITWFHSQSGQWIIMQLECS